VPINDRNGFAAGLLVCPELIKPSEWLPVVWGSEGEDEPAFDSLDHLNRVLGLVMEHYNDVARTLIERPHSYGPLFAVDKRHNEIVWETWIAGFEKAAKSRPAGWQKQRTRCQASSRSLMSPAATRASQLNSSTLRPLQPRLRSAHGLSRSMNGARPIIPKVIVTDLHEPNLACRWM
jgi:yecA family protein